MPTVSTAREKYCALIPHPTEPRALVVPADNAWSLPEFVPENDVYDIDLVQAHRALRQQFGTDLTIRYAVRLPEPAFPGPLTTYVVEPLCSEQSLSVARQWIGRDFASDLDMRYPRQRAVLAAWFADAVGAPLPGLDFSWWKSGWLAETTRWLLPLAEDLGYAVTGPVELLKSFYTSGTVRVPARPVDLYLKAIPPPLTHEVTLVRSLADATPARFPAILAADEQGRWMVTRDMGGRPLDSDIPPPRWEQIARTYGELQIAWASRECWLKLGCLDLRLERFAAAIDDLFSHVPERLRGLGEQLSEGEQEQLRATAPRLKQIASALADVGLPMTLEHGDLHAGNLRVTDHDVLFYDWSHACVTHPFFGLGDLVADDDWFPGQPDFNDRVRDAYLEPWTAFAPMPQLQAAFRLSQALRDTFQVLHQGQFVATYQQLLGGHDPVPETPGGNGLQQMQWWLAQRLRRLIEVGSRGRMG